MPSFHTQRHVRHSAEKMFALIADIERYPEFLPMCEALTIHSRSEQGDDSVLTADMRVGYKMINESFTTEVHLQPRVCRIDVRYLNGPFKHLESRWQFLPIIDEKKHSIADFDAMAVGTGGIGESDRSDRAAVKFAEKIAMPATKSPFLVDKFQSIDKFDNFQTEEKSAVISSNGGACLIDFYIDYTFKNPILSALMGTMFDTAFRKFATAFESRADAIYGICG